MDMNENKEASARSLKQWLGDWLIPRLPCNRHSFDHLRLELNGIHVRALHRLDPRYRMRIHRLRRQSNLLVNIGCGPFGKPGWINLDLFQHLHVTLRADCRKVLPLADGSCLGIHVEHFLEHLNPFDERRMFLEECQRCLQPDGILRVIVPDVEKYVRAYLEPGWGMLNQLSCGGEKPEVIFKCKMDVLNHVFHQDWEHYAGYDAQSLELVLRSAGFRRVIRCEWQNGEFPGGCIDRELHRPYSLYFEAG